MAEIIYGLVGIVLWGVWAAVGIRAYHALPWTRRTGTSAEGAAFFCVLLAPLIATVFIAQWIFERLGSEGKHRRKLEEMRRERELLEEKRKYEEEFDKLLEGDKEEVVMVDYGATVKSIIGLGKKK